MIAPTRKQKALLDFIRAHHRDGMVPKYGDMVAHMGAKSNGSVGALLERLVERGHLIKCLNHGYRLIDRPPDAFVFNAQTKRLEKMGAGDE